MSQYTKSTLNKTESTLNKTYTELMSMLFSENVEYIALFSGASKLPVEQVHEFGFRWNEIDFLVLRLTINNVKRPFQLHAQL